jgi:hypothetical protein
MVINMVAPTPPPFKDLDRIKLTNAFALLFRNSSSVASLLKNRNIIDLVNKEGAATSIFRTIGTLGVFGAARAILPAIMVLSDNPTAETSFLARPVNIITGMVTGVTTGMFNTASTMLSWLPINRTVQAIDNANPEQDATPDRLLDPKGIVPAEYRDSGFFFDVNAPETPPVPKKLEESDEEGDLFFDAQENIPTQNHSDENTFTPSKPVLSDDYAEEPTVESATSSSPLSVLMEIVPLLQQSDLLLVALQDPEFVQFLHDNKRDFDTILDGLSPTFSLLLSNLLFNETLFPPADKQNSQDSLGLLEILKAHISAPDFMEALPDELAPSILNLIKTAIDALPDASDESPRATLPYADFTLLGVALIADLDVRDAACNLATALQETGAALAQNFPVLIPAIVENAIQSETLKAYGLEAEPVAILLKNAMTMSETTDVATAAIFLASDIARHHSDLLNAPTTSAPLRSLRRPSNAPADAEGDAMSTLSTNASALRVQSALPYITPHTIVSCKALLMNTTLMLDTLANDPQTGKHFSNTLDKILPGIPPDTLIRALPLLEPLLDMVALQVPAINQKITEIVHLLTALDNEHINANNRSMHTQNKFLELLQHGPVQASLEKYLADADNFKKFAGTLDSLLNDDAYIQGTLGAKGKNSFLKRASISGTEVASLFKNIKKAEPFLNAYQEWSKALTDPTRDPDAFTKLCTEAVYNTEVRNLAHKIGKGLFFFNVKECVVGFAIKAFFDQPFHKKLHAATKMATQQGGMLDLATYFQTPTGPFDKWPSMKHAFNECNFYGLQLRKAHFDHMKIDGFNFNHTRLTDCQWKDSIITNCQFTGMRWDSGTNIDKVTMDIPSFVSLITALSSKQNSKIPSQDLQAILEGLTLTYNGKYYQAGDLAKLDKSSAPPDKASLCKTIMSQCAPQHPSKPLAGLTAIPEPEISLSPSPDGRTHSPSSNLAPTQRP